MITVQELKGLMAMMPAFTTPDGGSPGAKETINVAELERAVDRIIRDGVDVITTTGSFGESTRCYGAKKENSPKRPSVPRKSACRYSSAARP